MGIRVPPDATSLTDTAVRNSKSGAKTRRLFDERVLYPQVSPAGGGGNIATGARKARRFDVFSGKRLLTQACTVPVYYDPYDGCDPQTMGR
jgi:hypothetical protein